MLWGKKLFVQNTLSESGKPSNAGQKSKRKGAQKKVTMQVQKMLTTSEDSFVSRVATKRQSLCSDVLNPATLDAATSVQSTGFLSPFVVSSGQLLWAKSAMVLLL